MAHLDSRANADNRVIPVLLDLLVRLGCLACADPEEVPENKAQKVKTDCRDLQDHQVNEVSAEKLDLQEQLDPLERQDCGDEEENKGREDNRVELQLLITSKM